MAASVSSCDCFSSFCDWRSCNSFCCIADGYLGSNGEVGLLVANYRMKISFLDVLHFEIHLRVHSSYEGWLWMLPALEGLFLHMPCSKHFLLHNRCLCLNYSYNKQHIFEFHWRVMEAGGFQLDFLFFQASLVLVDLVERIFRSWYFWSKIRCQLIQRGVSFFPRVSASHRQSL